MGIKGRRLCWGREEQKLQGMGMGWGESLTEQDLSSVRAEARWCHGEGGRNGRDATNWEEPESTVWRIMTDGPEKWAGARP